MLPATSWRLAAACARARMGTSSTGAWFRGASGAAFSSQAQQPNPEPAPPSTFQPGPTSPSTFQPEEASVMMNGSDGLHSPSEPPHSMPSLPELDPSVMPEDPWGSVLACTAPEPPSKVVIHVFSSAADSIEWVHTATGLPWWASIPLTTLSLRLMLMPLSLLNAKIVRSNFAIYKEAVTLSKSQQAGNISSLGPKTASIGTVKSTDQAQLKASPSESEVNLKERLELTSLSIKNFAMLRKKCGVPHPLWMVGNTMAQVPVLLLTTMTLRQMANVNWPGFTTEGALWFPDLTQIALHVETMQQPMGAAGFILPTMIATITITSIRMGVGASGVHNALSASSDRLSQLLQYVPPLLYTLTIASLYFKVQAPHAVLLSWTTAAVFTLSFQLALKNPKLQALASIPNREAMAKRLASILGDLKPSTPSASELSSGPMYTTALLPPELVQKVSSTGNPDILVIMGAQLSAQHRFAEAMYCIDKALLLAPTHVRAHYSRGQVFSMTKRWPEAERSFLEAASHEENAASKGQALYCAGSALHSQGQLRAAIERYREALELWKDQPVTQYSLANALFQSGRHAEALEVVEAALPLKSSAPFQKVLEDLRGRLNASLGIASAASS